MSDSDVFYKAYSNYDDAASIILSYDIGDGSTSQLDFATLDHFTFSRSLTLAIYGVIVGLSFFFLIAMPLVTRNKHTPMFMLNMACIIFLFVDAVLYLCVYDNIYHSVTYKFTTWPLFSTKDSAIHCAQATTSLIVIMLIECSLVYQTRVLFRSPNKNIQRFGVIATSIAVLLAIAVCAVYLANLICTSRYMFDYNATVPSWTTNVPQWIFAASTAIVSVLLLSKLFMAIRTRRHLGLRQFSIFHILFVTSFQSLIVPSILTFLSSATTASGESLQVLAILGRSLVAISLPLSTMWAGAVTDSSVPSSAQNSYLQVISNTSYKGLQSDASLASATGTYRPDRHSSGVPGGANSPGTLCNEDGDDIEKATGDDDEARFWKQVEQYADGLQNGDLDSVEGKV